MGVNCALGAAEMRPFLAELAGIAGTRVSCYPNAGLPNAFGEYDEHPEQTAALLAGFARDNLVNVVGGCCGTTPAHIRAIVDAVHGVAPRSIPEIPRRLRLSGLEPLTGGPETGFINVGDGTPTTPPYYANADGTDFGVNIDPDGDLHGYAWSENGGWINFDGGALATPAQPARIVCASLPGMPLARFTGYVWAENFGWMNLDVVDAGKFVAIELASTPIACCSGRSRCGRIAIPTLRRGTRCSSAWLRAWVHCPARNRSV